MTSFAFILGVVPLVHRQRPGRRDAPVAGHGRVLGHDRRDPLRPAVHAGVLRRLPLARPHAIDLVPGSLSGSG